MTRVMLMTAATLYVLLPLTAIGIGVHNLRTSCRLASLEERRRMLWVTTGFSLATWLIVAALVARSCSARSTYPKSPQAAFSS